ncbi:MAG: hypothetical protein M3Q45_02570 [Chloroflexota bacterium]|nr:hypothetical protein [Chloroflexota bacterium]
MSNQDKQFTLLAIALTAILISIAPPWAQQFPVLFAQDNTLTPTPTSTSTPTGTTTGTVTVTTTPTTTPTGSITPPFTATPTPSLTPFPGQVFTPTPSVTPFPGQVFTPTPSLTPFPGQVLTATPTATRPPRIVNEIVAPKAGDAVAGFTSIRGTALIDAYRRYDVHIAVAGSEEYRWLTTSYAVVGDGELYRLDTSQFADGFYDVRVRAIRDDGNYSESFLRAVEIRNANPPTPTTVRNELGTPLPTQPASPLLLVPTSTPTPDPAFVSRIENGQGIFVPQHDDVLRGVVEIIGTVNSAGRNQFVRYELALASAGRENWGWLYGSEEQFWQESIYALDTRRLADGFYDLRLRIVYLDENYVEYFVRSLRVANQTYVPDRYRPPTATPALGIFLPTSNATVGGVIEVRGVATIGNFLRWELYLAPNGTEQWSFLVSGQQPVSGLIARLDLGQLPLGVYDLRLRVISQDTQYQDYFARSILLAAPTPIPPATPVFATPITATIPIVIPIVTITPSAP